MSVFKRFYTLPVNDVTFIAALYSANLLPGDTKGLVESQPTYFLDFFIKLPVANESFDDFLKVMECSEYSNVKVLANSIRYELKKEEQQKQWHQYPVQQQKPQQQKPQQKKAATETA